MCVCAHQPSPSHFCPSSSSSSSSPQSQALPSRPQPHAQTHKYGTYISLSLALQMEMSTCIPNVNTLLRSPGAGPGAELHHGLRARHHMARHEI